MRVSDAKQKWNDHDGTIHGRVHAPGARLLLACEEKKELTALAGEEKGGCGEELEEGADSDEHCRGAGEGEHI